MPSPKMRHKKSASFLPRRISRMNVQMKRKEKKSLCPLNLWGQRLGELHSDSHVPVAARH